MKMPPGFAELCKGLHQDGLYLAQGSWERLACDCTDLVRTEHKADLRRFLADALQEQTPAELKGHINRQKPDISLNAAEAKGFFEYALRRLA